MKISRFFSLEEFNVSGAEIPNSVKEKIINLHAVPMDSVREMLGFPIWPSQKSGYRPTWWEKMRGRSGNSQHTFKKKGAVDWTCTDFQNNGDKLFDLIIDFTQYTRIAVYKTFIHCDYKDTLSGKRQVFTSTPDSKWTLIKEI